MRKISVIVPFYKGNQYIKELFLTVSKNQEYLRQKEYDVAIELIIVNDSPDVMVIIPEDTVGVDYKIVNHATNGGIHQARVTGLHHSDGEYILFLDQDDKLSNEFFYQQMSLLGENDVVISNAYLEQSDGSCLRLYNTIYDLELVRCLDAYLKSHNQITSPGQAILRRSVIPEAWKTMIMKKNGADDLFLWILLLHEKRAIVLNPECLYIHKYTGENLSASDDKMSISSLEVAEFLKQIEGIPESYVDFIVRSREFSFLWRESIGISKLKLVWNQRAILRSRVGWKVRRVLARKTRKYLLK